MKKSPETFQEICDAIVNEGASLNRVAMIIGINPATIFRWLGSSQEKPEEWLHEWGDFGIAPFHVHVKNANRICVAMLQGEAVRLSLKGFERVQVFQGRVQYEERLDIPPGMDADTMELLYGVRDRYKRDEMGNMIPLKIAEAPNAQLTAAVLRALGGEQWADRRSVDVKVAGPGVMRIGRQPRPQHQLLPRIDAPATPVAEPVNAEPPVPPQGEVEPPEMTTGKDGQPAQAAAPSPPKPDVRSQWEALLAKSRADTAHKRPSGIVNTGLSLLSDIPSDRPR